MKDLLNYIEKENARYLDELIEYLKIPTISSNPEYNNHIEEGAKWTARSLKNIGFENVDIMPTGGHPIVFGEWNGAGADAPTVLIYGHYDVQPVDPLEEWKTDPFDPVIRDGKLFGRGTSDDKGQVFALIKGVEAFLKKRNELPVNVKFLIEGEEECGSDHTDKFIYDNSGLLECDSALIADTEWLAEDLPSLCYGLRGISFIEVMVKGPNRDLHSGTYGGAVDNPLNVLCWMIAQLKDRYGRITIPGFYDDVLDLTQEERNGFAELPFYEDDYCRELGIKEVAGEVGYTTLERTWARPSLDLNGISGGFTGRGAKTILPSKAMAKISMRLVPHQRASDVAVKIERFLRSIAPPTVDVQIKVLHGANPVLVPRDSAGVKAAKIALKESFGKDPVFMREGGSIPIVELFQNVLRAPTVLMGLGLPTDNIHSPNENIDLKNFYGGIKAAAIFFDELAKF
jgi:acetylornithine deacetylase/succinyl-diaminopimelate desuccinylase-like protein